MVRALRLVLLVALSFASACGGATPEAKVRAAPRTDVVVRGIVTYEARHPTPTGASLALETRPARLVEVTLESADGRVIVRARTGEDGRFEARPAELPVRLVLAARVHAEGIDVAVAHDGRGERTHRRTVALDGSSAELRIHAADADPDGFAGALHVLDTLLVGMRAARAWTSRELPPFFAHWERGGTRTWSYYHGERPHGSGRYAIELLGGDPGRQMDTDTDEHDEGIILHELGHFVMDRVSGDSSPGGDHPAGYLLDPGLAWEEARATWFATSVLGSPSYVDTIGIEGRGSLRVDHDLERGIEGPRGLGSEGGTAEILWDLADGAGGVPDADNDGIALGPQGLLAAMIAQSEAEGAFPALGTFLSFLVESRRVELEPIKALLVRGGNPVSLVPPPGVVDWPFAITSGQMVGGKIDGLTNPAPSGGPNRADTGYDASHAYRVQVPARGWITAELRIYGSGLASDHEDLDLELRDIRADPLTASRGETQTETISRLVDPGWYILYVRDGGSGNRAGYSLAVRTVEAPAVRPPPGARGAALAPRYVRLPSNGGGSSARAPISSGGVGSYASMKCRF